MNGQLEPGIEPRPVELEGEQVHIVPLALDQHAKTLFSISHGPGASRHYRFLPGGPFADVQAYRDHLDEWMHRPGTLTFTLLDRPSREPFGTASLMRIDAPNRCLEIGYIWFSPESQRRTAATEAMFLIALHVFETLEYRRYEWKCDARNEPSRRAALRLGFSFEGIFRNHMIVRGGNRDTAWFSMIEEDWPERKAAFLGWLSKDNFDPEGRQRRNLGSFR